MTRTSADPHTLPDIVLRAVAEQIATAIDGREAGHCTRIDSIRRADAAQLVDLLRERLPYGAADVHVLVDRVGEADGKLSVPAERAVELRNRKERPLILMVPVGSGSAASSLDNSFARIDVTRLLATAADALLESVGDQELQAGVRQVARELGRTRPVEAWARFVAAVAAEPTWEAAGAALWEVGLIPDLGGPELVGRLSRNAACVRAIARPGRAVASVADRLTTAALVDGPARDRIMRFLTRPEIDLSDAPMWAALLPGDLTFEVWPLVDRPPTELNSVRLDAFLKDDGTLRAGTRLNQEGPGELPYVETGPDTPGSVLVKWRTDPPTTAGVDRWLLEVLPPADLRDPDAAPVARQTVKGDKNRATIRIDVAEEDVADNGLVVVRLTAIDADGQPVLLRSGGEAVDESQQFALRWEEDPVGGVSRRASAPSLAQARLDAALDGQDDLAEGSPTWSSGAFSVRLGGRRTAHLALSPALVTVQDQLVQSRGRAVAWEADGRLGEVLDAEAFEPVAGTLPPAFGERRRRLFERLDARRPRHAVEALEWDDELRQEVSTYCQTYRRALDSAPDDETRTALLALDTVRLSIDTVGHPPIAAVLVLPLHPLRLSWAAEYDATLTRWAGELSTVGRTAAKRRQAVDARLVRRVTPANLPFAIYGVNGLPYVYAREATLGTGIYLHADEAEPGAAVQAVFEVLGLDRRDVAAEVPPASVAERFAAYRAVNPGQDGLRVLVYNAGSGELLARALAESVLREPDRDEELAAPPARLEITAYSNRPSYTDPVPALTDLQRAVATQQVSGARSHLTPPLGLTVRAHSRLAGDHEAANIGVVADLAVTRTADAATVAAVAVPDAATSFRNLLTPAQTQRVAAPTPVWRTAPAVRLRNREGAVDAVDAHRSYQAALSIALGYAGGPLALTAQLDAAELDTLRAAHERADWVVTLDRNLGLDLFTAADGDAAPYLLDYAPDFLEGLGPRLTVTTTHRGEVERLLADAMHGLDLAAVEDSVRLVLDHLQVVSGRLALRLVGRSTLATEAVSLAALVAHLRRRGELDGCLVVPVDAHQEVFGDTRGDSGVRRCDVIVVRTTARTMRMECIEVKSRRASALPAALVDDVVDQLDATVAMLHDTFFRTDPPRIDAELQRARLGGILRHHADRALAMGLLDRRRRGEIERMIEKVEDGALVPEIGRRGYVISLAGTAGFPAMHRGVKIDVLTAAELGSLGFTSRRGAPVAPAPDWRAEPAPTSAEPTRPRPSPRPRNVPPAGPEVTAELPAVVPGALVGSSTDDEQTVVIVDPLRAEAPPAPGSKPRPVVELPQAVDVTLGTDAHAADVSWRISTAGSPHLFVLGIPGQGKSVTTRRILNSFADQGLPALVVDFHGDMAAAPAGGAAVLDAAQGLPITPFELDEPGRYREVSWELSEVIGYVCGLGEIQRNAVYDGVRAIYEAKGFPLPASPDNWPTMEDLATAVAAVDTSARTRNVVARLRPLSDFGLFADPAGSRPFADLLRQGVVIDVHGLMEQVQRAAGAFVLRKVYREMFRWGQTKQLRLAVVLDEAHRLARDVTLPKIMKEGRKYGVAVVVASQGVEDFHPDVLGNAGTKVAFRCNYPQSRKVAGFLRGRSGQDMSEALEGLAVGQAYVSTPDHASARKVFMARD
ncbi:helicase HerA domain-containing protein [Pseudonocardia sp. CA-107938]|uniref:helicase HerA domain-containing protein n=1 Tax=Pseudonocardia sp. CA-107938 TaxID=3240021 RepID=UPI003D912F84